MNIPFPFDSILIFGWLGVMLLVGVVLRSSVRFFQNYLIPSCMIGGIIGMVLVNAGVIRAGFSEFETFAYHLFNISFISVGLTAAGSEEKGAINNKDLVKGSLWMALLQGIIFPLQALIGGGIILAFNALGYNLFPTFGFLVPLGFVQGPGQALSIGKVWEKMGFEHAASIGLTFAAAGFMVAFLVGVPIVNWGIRKGLAHNAPKQLPLDFIRGIISRDTRHESAGEQTTHSANIDTLAFQTALIGLVYLLSYLVVSFIGSLMSPANATTIWGFFFFIGLLIALLVRVVMGRLGIGHLIDPGIQRRVTGWSVDFLIVATIMAVKLIIVWEYILPIAAISIATTVVTTAVVLYLGRRIWSYNLERTASIYGTVTGTVSTGLLLLRIVDPDFRTTVAMELGILIIFVSPIIITCMLLVSAPLVWGWSMALTMWVFAGMMVASLVAMLALKMEGKRRF
jgi:ESS family glutamate:Na+ symporter